MTLLTPPSSSHRAEKENKSIQWDVKLDHIRFFPADSDISALLLSTTPSAGKQAPKKSILKKHTLPFECDEEEEEKSERETTPEPQDPLTNLTYLDSPVSRILDPETSLRDLTESYSVLAARIRAGVGSDDTNTDADASWPLFQPIRKNQQAIADRMVEDLGKVFVDPAPLEEQPKFPLSPRKTPSKPKVAGKKRGMSAEQAKYGRDLSITVHSVLKLLSLVFTQRCLYSLFTDSQLHDIFAAVLAIPNARELPTPHSRKTCALSIWVIQFQRLPEAVLDACKDRVAYVVSRGIDGELGKDGKKGSRADGLRAIHDLCLYLPSVFVPAFAQILPSIVTNLYSPSGVVRVLASQAIGGFAQALAGLGRVPALRWKAARMLQTILLEKSAPAPATPSKSPSKSSSPPVQLHAMIRLLRSIFTHYINDSPNHCGSSPFVAISMLSSIIVILAPILRLMKVRQVKKIAIPEADRELYLMLRITLSMAMSSKNPVVQEFSACLVRVLAWVSTTTDLGGDDEPKDDDEGEGEVTDEEMEAAEKEDFKYDCLSRHLFQHTQHGAGMSSMVALLEGYEEESESPEAPTEKRHNLLLACEIFMSEGTTLGKTSGISAAVFNRLLDLSKTSQRRKSQAQQKTLLPSEIFSLPSELLAVDYASPELSTAVRTITTEFPSVPQLKPLDNIAWLPNEEGGFLDQWLQKWRSCLLVVEDKHVDVYLQVWKTMMKKSVEYLQEHEKTDGLSRLAQDAIDDINTLAHDSSEQFNPPVTLETLLASPFSPPLPKSLEPSSNLLSTPSLRKFALLRLLFSALRVIPMTYIQRSAFILCDSFSQLGLHAVDSDDTRKMWALFCAEVLVTTEPEHMEVFWGLADSRVFIRELEDGRYMPRFCPGKTTPFTEWGWSEEQTRTVWRVMAEKVLAADAHWEVGAVLMCVPFSKESHKWQLTTEDYALFSQLLSMTKDRAADFGHDSITVLTHLCGSLVKYSQPARASPRLVDIILTDLQSIDYADSDLPVEIIKFVNQTLIASYPPRPEASQTEHMWMLRSAGKILGEVSKASAFVLLQGLGEGLATWIADPEGAVEDCAYGLDVVTLYENVVLRAHELPRTVETIESLAGLLASPFCGRKVAIAKEGLLDVFSDLWQTCYADIEHASEQWPEKIQVCLRIVAGEEPIVTAVDCPIDPVLLEDTVPSIQEPPSTPIRPSRPCTPSPQTARPVLFSPVLNFPESPICVPLPSTPPSKRSSNVAAPVTPSPKKPVSSNKENRSPLVEFIGRSSTVKRKLDADEDTIDEDPTPRRRPKIARMMKKRARTSSFGRPANTDGVSDDDDTDALPILSNPQVLSQPSESNGTSKKRKRVFMDCISIPVKASAPGSVVRFSDTVKIGPPTRSLRRVKSAPTTRKTKEEPITVQEDIVEAFKSRRVSKRRRVDRLNPSTPTHHDPSSDDDPHLGQVTPHHLISPALHSRRTTGDEHEGEDSPSDDDDWVEPGSSPLKAAAKRKVKRTVSMSSIPASA